MSKLTLTALLLVALIAQAQAANSLTQRQREVYLDQCIAGWGAQPNFSALTFCRCTVNTLTDKEFKEIILAEKIPFEPEYSFGVKQKLYGCVIFSIREH